MANPAFGSPAWDQKYGIKRFQKGGEGGRSATMPAPTAAAVKSKIEPRSRGKGTGRGNRQPISQLAESIRLLEASIRIEPETADKETLEGCLRSMKSIQGKNESEERGTA